MTRFKIKLVFMGMQIMFIPLYALNKEKSPDEVRIAAMNWINTLPVDSHPEIRMITLEAFIFENYTAAYIAHLDPVGFCICGADELALPVYLYNPKANFDPLNPEYTFILEMICEQTNALNEGLKNNNPDIEIFKNALNKRKAHWEELITGKSTPSYEKDNHSLLNPTSVELPLTSKWSQGDPYNNMCPVLTPPDEHTVTGCVATATAQIMKFWEWPVTGTGSKEVDYHYRWRDNIDQEPLSYNPGIPPAWYGGRLSWISSSGGRLRMTGYWDESLLDAAKQINNNSGYRNALNNLYNRLTRVTSSYSANFNTAYEWNDMTDIIYNEDDPGAMEIALLCHHVGIAVGMDYGICGSFASTNSALNALEIYFKYDPDAVYGSHSTGLLMDEIAWFRPIQIRGVNDEDNGHSWVIYGYDQSTDPPKFLMNLGLGESTSEVWTTLDDLEYFPFDQAFIARIAPKDVVRFVGGTISPYDGTPDSPYQTINQALLAAPSGTKLVFKAGTTHTLSSENKVITKPLLLVGKNVQITAD